MCFAVLEAAMWKAACDGHTGNLPVLTGGREPARTFGIALYVSAASIRPAQRITHYRAATAPLWPHNKEDWVFVDLIEKMQDQHIQFSETAKLFPARLGA